MLTLPAPAKLNLTLEVLAKRQDGFHEIRSVIQIINLCDSLSFQPGQNIEFKSNTPDWHPQKSLVSRAASLLHTTTGCPKGATIEMDKQIPLLSGLGGDSSDAATVLLGLNKLWELGLSLQELSGLASQLGSDVTFFLYGGTARLEGRGEKVTPLPPPPHMWVVLVVPPVPRLPGKTERLYASLKSGHYTDGQITERLAKALNEGKDFNPSMLFNTFENIAFKRSSEINLYRQHMAKIVAADVHLAGSGPALFTLTKDRTRAEGLYIQLKKQNLEAYLTDTPATTELPE